MKLSLLSEDLEKTIQAIKKKYSHRRNHPSPASQQRDLLIDEIAAEVPEQAIEWVVNSVSYGSGKWPEDKHRFLKAYENYFKNRGNQKYVNELKTINPQYRNILNYTLSGLELASRAIEPLAQFEQNFRELPEDAYVAVMAMPYRMIQVESAEAAVALSGGTEWCTSNYETAEDYLEEGSLFVIFKNNQKIAQYFEGYESQLMDLHDDPFPTMKARDLIEVLGLPVDPGYIERNSMIAYNYAFGVVNGRSPELEPIIMKDPRAIVKYAKNVLDRRRWKEAEPILLTSPEFAYYYTVDILKKPWPEAEPIISKDQQWWSRYLVHKKNDNWYPYGWHSV